MLEVLPSMNQLITAPFPTCTKSHGEPEVEFKAFLGLSSAHTPDAYSPAYLTAFLI